MMGSGVRVPSPAPLIFRRANNRRYFDHCRRQRFPRDKREGLGSKSLFRREPLLLRSRSRGAFRTQHGVSGSARGCARGNCGRASACDARRRNPLPWSAVLGGANGQESRYLSTSARARASRQADRSDARRPCRSSVFALCSDSWKGGSWSQSTARLAGGAASSPRPRRSPGSRAVGGRRASVASQPLGDAEGPSWAGRRGCSSPGIRRRRPLGPRPSRSRRTGKRADRFRSR